MYILNACCIMTVLICLLTVASLKSEEKGKCRLEDITPETVNGMEGDYADGDTLTLIETSYICRAGFWIENVSDFRTNDFDPQVEMNDHRRHKRGIGIIGAIGIGLGVGAGIGALICFFACKDPPPPNSPPSITCPSISKDLYAPRGETSLVVTWDVPTGQDPEDGALTATLVSGSNPGSTFARGTHTIIYSVTDSNGLSGFCNFQFKVSVITCTPIPWPENGYVYCGQSEFIYGTSCDVGCNEGFEAIPAASNNRQIIICERDSSDGVYDTAIPSCSAITCNGSASELQPRNGNAVCTHSSYKYDTTCFTSCNNGYSSTTGFVSTTCQANRTWTKSLQSCQDSEPPSLSNCPGTVNVHTDRGKTSATLFWAPPTASDNSGNVTLNQTIGSPPGSLFEVGLHEIRYRAIDWVGNTSPDCIFFLQVDELRCNPPAIDDRFMYYECPEGFTYGSMCILHCMGSFQLIGNANITCEKDGHDMIWTWDQTKQHCDTNPCEPLSAPTNGAITCARWLFGQVCQMQCSSNYDIPLGTVNSNGQTFTGEFKCSETTGKYVPDVVPNCTAQRRPNMQYLQGEYFYYTGDCNDAAVLETIKENFINQMQILQNTGYDGVCPDNTECNVDNVDVTCGPVSGRRKRRTSSKSVFVKHLTVKRSTHEIRVDFRITTNTSDTSGTPANSYFRFETVMVNMSEIIRKKAENGDLNVGGLTADASSLVVGYSEVVCPSGTTIRWSTITCVPCASGTYLDISSQQCQNCPLGTYKDNELDASCTQCPPLKSTMTTGATALTDCLDVCSPGHYSSTGLAPCNPCTKSFYQSDYKKTECQQCTPGLTTAYTGSVSSDNCTAFDIVLSTKGENISFGRLEKSFTSWSVSMWAKFSSAESSMTVTFTYGSNISSIEISPGNTSLTLLSDVSTNILQLQVRSWNHISTSVDFDSKRWKFFTNGKESFDSPFTTSEADDNYRVEAESKVFVTATETDRIGISQFLINDHAISLTEITIISNSCLSSYPNASISPASLNLTSLEGQTTVPSQCDDTNNCLPDPCNGFNCTDETDSFVCHCERGYSGLRCDVEPNPCSNSPCINGGTCHNAADDYNCSCLLGYKGKNCHIQIVNGGWGNWMEWSVCSKTCGGGTRSRSRLCNSPQPDNDGIPCNQSLSSETDGCSSDACPSCATLRRGYGNLVSCSFTNDSHQICTVSCRDGLTFLPNKLPDTEYICGPNTSYSWTNTPPACSKPRGPQSISTTTVFTYTSMTCTEASSAVTLIQQASSQYQCVNNGTCTMYTDTPECTAGRKRRSTSVNVHITFTVQLQNNSELNLETFTSTENASQALTDLYIAVQEIEATTIQINESSSLKSLILSGVTYTSSTISTSVNVICLDGQGSLNAFCVDCPVGTYSINGICELCQKGTYQDQTSQSLCLPCPSGFTTAIVAATDVTYCTVTANTTTSTSTVQSGSLNTSLTDSTSPPTSASSSTSATSTSSNETTTSTTTDSLSSLISTAAPTSSSTDHNTNRSKGNQGENEGLPIYLIVSLSAVTVLIIVGVVIATLLVLKRHKRNEFRFQRRAGSIASLSMVRPQTDEKLEITDYENFVYQNHPPLKFKY